MPSAWPAFRPALFPVPAALLAGALVTGCASSGSDTALAPPPSSDDSGPAQDASLEASRDSSLDSPAEAFADALFVETGTGQGSQCFPCSDTQPCGPNHHCVHSPHGDPFCAQDCSGGPCPSAEFDCVDLDGYDPGAALTGRICVPSLGASCGCTEALEGQKRSCLQASEAGSCTGFETCHQNHWSSCDAPLPSAEICDGKDNDCNGFIDAQDPGISPSELCPGASPPHTSNACVQGQCTTGSCDSGWARYPSNLPDIAGCACPVEDADTVPGGNQACTSATDLGSLSDTATMPITVDGTLSSDSDVDWYRFNSEDTLQVPAFNTYRVHIEFVSPSGNPGDEYRMEVIRGQPGNPCPSEGGAAGITSYDWCADSTTDPTKPADNDQSAPYRIRVYRKPGAPGTCNSYRLQIVNGGTGNCPSADSCGAR